MSDERYRERQQRLKDKVDARWRRPRTSAAL